MASCRRRRSSPAYWIRGCPDGIAVNNREVPFHGRFTVRLHDTDAAGVMFFGHLFRHAHDAYEAFMADLGFPLDGLIRAQRWQLPLVHAEADYSAPMRHGDMVNVAVSVAEIGRSAFTLTYDFRGSEGRRCAAARTVHVCISAAAGGKCPLPPALRAALAGCLPPV